MGVVQSLLPEHDQPLAVFSTLLLGIMEGRSMWSNLPYTTLDDIHMNIDPNMGTQDDGYLSRLSDQAQAVIDSYVGFPFQLDGSISTPAIRVYNGTDTSDLIIDPCQQLIKALFIDRVVYAGSDGVYRTGNTQTFDITADCILGPNKVVNNYKPGYAVKRFTGELWYSGMQNYVISGIWGYRSVPTIITRCATRTVAHWYKMRDTNYADVETESGVKEKYGKVLPPDVIQMLEMYRKHSFLGSAGGAW